jgi:hypothetical protein
MRWTMADARPVECEASARALELTCRIFIGIPFVGCDWDGRNIVIPK